VLLLLLLLLLFVSLSPLHLVNSHSNVIKWIPVLVARQKFFLTFPSNYVEVHNCVTFNLVKLYKIQCTITHHAILEQNRGKQLNLISNTANASVHR
jgi:hypothetical protein